MREELLEGARLFDAGHYWEAHEAWEGPWMRATGEDRAFVQGLILLAAALHKRFAHGSLTARNYHKARRHLAPLPDRYGGVDLRHLEAEVWAALQADTPPELRLPRLD